MFSSRKRDYQKYETVKDSPRNSLLSTIMNAWRKSFGSASKLQHYQFAWNKQNLMSKANSLHSTKEKEDESWQPVAQHETFFVFARKEQFRAKWNKRVGLSSIWNFYQDSFENEPFDTAVEYKKCRDPILLLLM